MCELPEAEGVKWGTNCIMRCAVLSAAHVLSGSTHNAAEAQRLDHGLVNHLRSAKGREIFTVEVMNGMNYADIDSRIRHYSKNGFAGNIELSGLSSFTGRAIDVYEPAAGGSITVTSHVAPGASEHDRIRLWRANEHYQSITFCPPPPPRASTPLPTNTPTPTPTARAAEANRPAPRRPSLRRAASAATVEASPGNPSAPTKKKTLKDEWLDSIIKQFIAYGNERLLLTRRNMALVIFNSSFARIKATDPGTESD